MATRTCLDIETAPIRPPPPTGATEDSLKAWKDEALDPTRAHITAIGIKTDDIEAVFCEPEERATLNAFWKYVEDNTVNGFVGYNTRGFDELFLLLRTPACGLAPPQLRQLGESLDLMKRLFPFEMKFRSKDDACRAFGVAAPVFPNNGADCPRLQHEGRVEAVKVHCLDGVRREWEIYKRLKGAHLVQPSLHAEFYGFSAAVT